MERRPAYDLRFEAHLEVLGQYVAREGHATVPVDHVEEHNGHVYRLGAWVSYQRSRKHKNLLAPERIALLDAIEGWQWGPLRPGPVPRLDRNEAIRKERADGARLGDIAQRYGLSRQRVHQIVTGAR